jgi:pentatricopeptide repeat protein
VAAARYFSAETAVTAKTSTAVGDGGVRKAEKSGGGKDTLGRRLLSLVYTKRSAAITINKWKEDGNTVRKYELNRIVRVLRKLKRHKHALEICEWMNTQQDIKLQDGDYAVHLDLIAKIRGLNSAEKYFEDLPDKLKGQPTCTALLHNYVQHKESSKAEALMEKMSECGFLNSALPFNHMLSLYISNGELEKVPEMIRELKKNASPDIMTYNLWLRICAQHDDVDIAEKIFLELQKAKLVPDWVTYSTLTSIYVKHSLDEKARATLQQMEKLVSKQIRVGYSSLISLNTSLGNKDDIQRIWKIMKSLFRKLSDVEYICMISSLIKLDEIEEAENLYKEWGSVSPTGDCRIPNLLLSAYVNKNRIGTAEKLYNQLLEKGISPSYTTWVILTWGYLKKKQIHFVLDCFKKALGSVKKWNPDAKLVNEVFKILEEQGNIKGAEQLLVTLRHARHVSTDVYNSVWRVYEKAGKMPLVVEERMAKDKVPLNDETRRLIQSTSKMCVSEASDSLT